MGAIKVHLVHAGWVDRERDKRTRIGNSEMYKITSSDPMTHYTGHAVYSRISMDLGRVKGRSRYDPGSRVLTLAESIDSRRFTADPTEKLRKVSRSKDNRSRKGTPLTGSI